MLPLPDTTTATRKRIARKYKLAEFPDPRPFLHIRCGDDILDKLDLGGVPGDKIRWSDVLCEGPLHSHPREEDRQRERASYLSTRFLISMAETYRETRGADWRVDQCEHYDETVLWFEADLFDQAILVYLLTRLHRFAERTRFSLVCIGGFPGVQRFLGLGQLSPEQLATLHPKRQPLTRRQWELAREAWVAFTAPDPRRLVKLARTKTRALPYLPAAVSRYLAEYPSTVNGLGQTAQWALEEISAGAGTPAVTFQRVQQRETRPFMGDAMFYAVLRDLAAGDHPALAGAHPNFHRLQDAELRDCRVWLTEQGRKLLRRRADWCQLSGMTGQFGGVTLRGARPRWRWSPKEGRLMEQRRR